MKRLLVIEPYFGLSHRRLVDGMQAFLPHAIATITMRPRKWKWRMRGAALTIAEQLREVAAPDAVFTSSMLSLADLVALSPRWLADVPKLVYFHENQLVYPARLEKEWDFHFGLTDVTTALAADRVAWNSAFNRDSFLAAIDPFLRKFPDHRPPRVAERIAEKSRVLPVPLDPREFDGRAPPPRRGPARILWNHRWEFDKDPETFFAALDELDGRGVPFELVVLGEAFAERPAVFDAARARLAPHVVHFGFAPDRAAYLDLCASCDVVVSTAIHEFFGVAVMEAVRLGCVPLVPDRLAYPELFPSEFRYADGALAVALGHAIESIDALRARDVRPLAEAYAWPRWIDAFCDFIG